MKKLFLSLFLFALCLCPAFAAPTDTGYYTVTPTTNGFYEFTPTALPVPAWWHGTLETLGFMVVIAAGVFLVVVFAAWITAVHETIGAADQHEVELEDLAKAQAQSEVKIEELQDAITALQVRPNKK